MASGFSKAEREAMQQRAEELRASKGVKGAAKKAKELEACIEAIDKLEGLESQIGQLLHRIVTEEAPELDPKTWYGFPSYARDGKVVVFMQPGSKFGTRYSTIGFQEEATIDDGDIFPTSYAVLAVTPAVEKQLRALVARA